MAQTKIALVTGAGSGIGRASALALAKHGWTVVLTGRRREALEETARLAGEASTTHVHSCDVSDADAVEALFHDIENRFGRLDLLFNNAGIFSAGGTIDEIPVETWNAVVGVNLTGAFLCARSAFALMRRQSPQGGRIINNGSISAHAPRPHSVPYTATKHAITGLTKTLSLDGRPFDIACGQIDIGNAASEMTDQMGKGILQANGTLAPEPLMDVAHVADAVLHMASLPLEANVLFMTVMATKMPFVGRG
ncbi:SDR family oxidoreductase [Tianweitania sp. BSSL-BM11]|uniref:SDR family oxidoreductase n=1 Tax=Tianweitania aestuarii TaxID=2814886 RepID=A0ABS5RW95_9HYPH|nr:SDR family oxidoreductase [Tianweitania aestuarii]MBS9721341.1 SDR family oxidoreductase [Tianweitania aestuarii]